MQIFRALLEGASFRDVAREHEITVERVRTILELMCALVTGPELYRTMDEEPGQVSTRRARRGWWIAKIDEFAKKSSTLRCP